MRSDREQIAKAFGRALRACRQARQLSQEDLAYSAGVDRTFVSRAERGERQPALATVFRLCGPLQVTPAELVHETDRQLQWTNKRKPREPTA